MFAGKVRGKMSTTPWKPGKKPWAQGSNGLPPTVFRGDLALVQFLHKPIIMTKVAFIILAAGDTHESLGRVVNALMGALEYTSIGESVMVIFDGAGTSAAASLVDSEHKYHDLFQKVRQHVSVCSYCAGAYEVKDKIEAAGLPLVDEFKGHPSFRRLVESGYHLLTF